MNMNKKEILVIEPESFEEKLMELDLEQCMPDDSFVDCYDLTLGQLMSFEDCNVKLNQAIKLKKEALFEDEIEDHERHIKYFNFLKDLINKNNVYAIILREE